MQLTYRGAHYTVSSQTVATIETPVKGTFLGAQYPIKSVKGPCLNRIAQPLSYRLAKYSI